jgi:hypothetical protein
MFVWITEKYAKYVSDNVLSVFEKKIADFCKN